MFTLFNFSYKFHYSPSVDCKLGQWEDWSNCSKSCGGGNRSRSRAVEIQEANGGNPCVENTSQNETCNSHKCPIDCQWGPYGEWMECTKSCGGGEKTRSRSKETSAENGGKDCPGNETDTTSCNEHSCPGNNVHMTLFLQHFFSLI